MRLLLVLLLVVIGLQTRAQVDWCDSVSYTVYPNPNLVFSVLGEVSDSLSSHVDTVDFTWEVCNSSLCFNDFGTFLYCVNTFLIFWLQNRDFGIKTAPAIFVFLYGSIRVIRNPPRPLE